jgi:hypothetical protein
MKPGKLDGASASLCLPCKHNYREPNQRAVVTDPDAASRAPGETTSMTGSMPDIRDFAISFAHYANFHTLWRIYYDVGEVHSSRQPRQGADGTTLVHDKRGGMTIR